MITLKIKRTNGQRALFPTYQTSGSAGLDLEARHSLTLPAGGFYPVYTGLCVEIPPGFEGQVRGRSGLATKGIFAHVGTIDSDYRGEIAVILFNLSGKEYQIWEGDRIAQLVISPVEVVTVEEVEELSPTERGTKGFGSTGMATKPLPGSQDN